MRADRSGISAQHMAATGPPWTMCPLLRIWRSERRPEQEALLGQARDIRGMILLGDPSPSANEAGSSGGGS